MFISWIETLARIWLAFTCPHIRTHRSMLHTHALILIYYTTICFFFLFYRFILSVYAPLKQSLTHTHTRAGTPFPSTAYPILSKQSRYHRKIVGKKYSSKKCNAHAHFLPFNGHGNGNGYYDGSEPRDRCRQIFYSGIIEPNKFMSEHRPRYILQRIYYAAYPAIPISMGLHIYVYFVIAYHQRLHVTVNKTRYVFNINIDAFMWLGIPPFRICIQSTSKILFYGTRSHIHTHSIFWEQFIRSKFEWAYIWICNVSMSLIGLCLEVNLIHLEVLNI